LNRSASDKKSLLIALLELELEGLVSKDEAVIISFLLGFILGYDMCWEHDSETSRLEWNGSVDFLKVSFDENRLLIITNKLSKYLGLNFKNKYDVEKLSFEIEDNYLPSKMNIDGRELFWSCNSIELRDDYVKMVESCLSSDKLKEELLFFDLRLKSKPTHSDYPDDINSRTEQLMYDLSNGKYSQKERDFLKALLEL
jgi:hypothetical protein